jgi:hypothetical protein
LREASCAVRSSLTLGLGPVRRLCHLVVYPYHTRQYLYEAVLGQGRLWVLDRRRADFREFHTFTTFVNTPLRRLWRAEEVAAKDDFPRKGPSPQCRSTRGGRPLLRRPASLVAHAPMAGERLRRLGDSSRTRHGRRCGWYRRRRRSWGSRRTQFPPSRRLCPFRPPRCPSPDRDSSPPGRWSRCASALSDRSTFFDAHGDAPASTPSQCLLRERTIH